MAKIMKKSAGLQAKFADARVAMCKALIEREVEVDMVIAAMLIKEHILFVGPPGCAKSLLLNCFMDFCGGVKLFSYLMTKFSTPEELYGPYSLSGLKKDEFYRVTKGKLPEAELAYIDEVFKGSPAVLNTLLTIINEGTYDDGRGSQPVPLRMLMASSNEVPRDDDGLNAMFDRFLLRKKVGYIQSFKGRQDLLWGGDHKAQFNSTITTSELDEAISEVADVPYSDEAKKTMDDIVQQLRAAGVNPSDRRLVKALKIGQQSAWLNHPARVAENPKSKLEVINDDFELMTHALWVDPETHPDTVKKIVSAVSNPILYQVTSYLLEAEQILQGIDTKDISKLAKSSAELKKLQEILNKLTGMKKHKRVDEAIDHVAGSIKNIRIAMAQV